MVDYEKCNHVIGYYYFFFYMKMNRSILFKVWFFTEVLPQVPIDSFWKTEINQRFCYVNFSKI